MLQVTLLYLSYYLLVGLGSLCAIAGHSGKDIIPRVSSQDNKAALVAAGWAMLYVLSFVVAALAFSQSAPHDAMLLPQLITMTTCVIVFLMGPAVIMGISEKINKKMATTVN